MDYLENADPSRYNSCRNNMNKKIGGCVILFNPDPEVINNIATYKDNIDVLIIIDNSPEENLLLINGIRKLTGEIIYEWLGGNKGIAKALNMACSIALENNCTWLLTMDQDSRFREGHFLEMVDSVAKIESLYTNVAIICPHHNIHEQFVPGSNTILQEVKSTMTSGNLVNLGVFQLVSGFLEKLFIDYVDHEYCLRLRKNKFRIIQNAEILLDHSLGDYQIKTVLGKKIGISNHNYIRRYYIARNGLYTARKYFAFDPSFCMLIIQNLIYDFGRVLFFEKNKFLKIKAMVIGTWHWMINRYGEFGRNTWFMSLVV